MKKSGLSAGVDAKPGKENEVLLFLKSFKPLASDVAGTVSWQALKIGLSRIRESVRPRIL